MNEENTSNPTSQPLSDSADWTRGHMILLLLILGMMFLLAVIVSTMRADIAVLETTRIPSDELSALAIDDNVIDATELEMLLFEVRSIRDDVQMAEDRAFNALSVLEIFGVILTVGSIILGAIGVFYVDRIQKLFNELHDTRERYNELMQNISLSLSLLPLAKEQYLANDLSGALKTYQEASKLNLHNPLPYSHMGYIYTKKENFNKAEEVLKEALHIKPDLAHANAGLGFVYRRRGDIAKSMPEKREYYANAERLILRGLAEFPALVDGEGESWWGTLGGLEKRRGNIETNTESRDFHYRQSAIYYRKALNVTPQSSYPLTNLALLEIINNDIENARKRYGKVILLAKNEIAAELGNYWAHGDLLIAILACTVPGDKIKPVEIQKILNDIKAILSESDIKDALNRIVETIETIQQVFEDSKTPYRSDLFELALDQLKTYPGYSAESRTAEPSEPDDSTGQ